MSLPGLDKLTEVEKVELFRHCMTQEEMARRNEYAATGRNDYGDAAFWHQRRWVWMGKAQEIVESMGRETRMANAAAQAQAQAREDAREGRTREGRTL